MGKNRAVVIREDDRGFYIKVKEGILRYASVRVREFSAGERVNCAVRSVGGDDPTKPSHYSAQCRNQGWKWLGTFEQQD